MSPYPYDWSQEIFIVRVAIDSSKRYPAFQTVGLDCQAPTLTPAWQAIFMRNFGLNQCGREPTLTT